jgi:alginate production protein
VVRLHHEDEDDADLTWFGARVSGETSLVDDVDIRYWMDLAFVRGSETRYEFDDLSRGLVFVEEVVHGDRSGEAMDIGASLVWSDVRWRSLRHPTLTLAYAYGSGDENGTNFFRETGLNDNNGKFNGVDRFRYYGELADPKLENLHVSTAALGFQFADESSVELLHHYYRQSENNVEHSLRFRGDVTGTSQDLGNEFDVVVGIEEWEHWEFEVVGAYFVPGKAFEDQDDAWLLTFKLNYNF